ncbi:MAG: Gx transporter family protein [Sphaerochaetaceae bacterium]|nr:Gx transporter family protein [Sphaerochaetaceae bacterium]
MISHTKVRIELVALFSACALFLSTIEYMIPKPVPFMRLGLANLPIILALGIFTYKEYFLLLLLKVLGQGLISGTIFSYIILFSLAGSLSSAIFMLLIFTLFKDKVSRVGISLGGALASAISQLFISRLILFKEATYVIAPLFLFSGLISSIILGIFANEFIVKSKWYSTLKESKV